MRRATLAPLLILSLFLVSCRSAAPPRPVDPGLAPLSADDPRPRAFLAALAAQTRERQRLRGIASLGLDGPEGSARAKQVVFLERPARLRVEVLGFLNQSAAVLTTDGVRYTLFRNDAREIEEGLVRAGLLWEVAGIALTPEEAVSVLLGAPTLPDPPELRSASARGAGIRLEVGLGEIAPTLVALLDFDALGRLARFALRGEGGGKLWVEANYSSYKTLAVGDFAHEIAIEDHQNRVRAKIRFDEVELNPPLPPKIFELPRSGRGETGRRDR